MNISKLLNPVPSKKPRFDEDTLVCDEYWLPTELIAYIITYTDLFIRSKFRLVSKKWYIAYDIYLRNKMFNDMIHVSERYVTRKQVLNIFVDYGHRLRWMFIHTSTLRDLLDIEPNFASLIPNVSRLRVTIDDGVSNQQRVRDFVAKLCKLVRIVIREFGSTADRHLASELDKSVAIMPHLQEVDLSDIDLDLNAFPGPNVKERAHQIVDLGMSVASIEPGTVASKFEMFKNVEILSIRGISSVVVLKEVTELVIDEKNFQSLRILEVHSEFDLSHADPVVNEEDGTTVTAMDLYLKICDIRRPQFLLRVGFILGACSKTNSTLIEREREFVIKLGKTSAEVLELLELTHYTPVGDYDPLTTLFYESAPRFPRLLFLYAHVSPTAATGLRIIEALNNPFLFPSFAEVIFYVDGSQSPEWDWDYNPIDPSRGFQFLVTEPDYEDEARMINENNDEVIPSWFLSDDYDDYDDPDYSDDSDTPNDT
ncbi:hypothetical protein GQ42DRAFT_23686 [Ramicandelaber brevisporus]|nr:hypothetical protein GQ42DRAFT_23686 [Ramicandelaber brevisporus]